MDKLKKAMTDISRYVDMMEKCSHCAFCEATCPVFMEDLLETHVARSRMELIRASLVDQTLPVSRRIKEVANRCLLCSSCRQTCPADVPVDDMVISARHAFYGGKRMNFGKRYLLKQIMSGRGLKGMMGKLGTIAGTLGISELPKLPDTPFEEMYSGTYTPGTKIRGRVVYYTGCGTNTLYPETGDAVMKTLLENGFEVILPEGLVCCGIPALAEGDLEMAREMMQTNLSILSKIKADAVVTDCTSCGMTLKEKMVHFLDDGPSKETARELAPKIREVTEYMAEKGLSRPPGTLEENITYHIPCHRGWHPGLADAPKQLLSKIPGLTVTEMEFPDRCCGAGGTFFLDYKDLSESIRSKKVKDIETTGADILVTQCPSCRSFIDSAMNSRIKIIHPISLIARSYA